MGLNYESPAHAQETIAEAIDATKIGANLVPTWATVRAWAPAAGFVVLGNVAFLVAGSMQLVPAVVTIAVEAMFVWCAMVFHQTCVRWNELYAMLAADYSQAVSEWSNTLESLNQCSKALHAARMERDARGVRPHNVIMGVDRKFDA